MTNIVPISFEKFSGRRWLRFKKMDFAAKDTLAPISAREAARAILSMPVGFIQRQGSYQLVALQGLEPEKNLLVDNNGRWRGGYLPHHYFCHPFLMIENESNTLVLCVDEESDLVTSKVDESAEAFFDSDKKPGKLVSDVVQFLGDHTAQLKSTQEICERLDQNRLIKPWPLQVQTNQGEIVLDAFYCIDEERLNSLSATALKELRNKDALTIAYAQLFSMLNVNLLVKELNNNHAADKLGEALPQEIDFENLGSGGLISFDNL